TGTPALTIARTVFGSPRTLTSSAPPSSASRSAARRGSAPAGTSQLRSARFTPLRTALQQTRISSTLTCALGARPQRLTPTESPTETRSTPARSAICAIWKSQATTPTILRPSRFILRSAMTVTLGSILGRRPRDAPDRGDHRAGIGAVLAGDVERAAVRDRREQHRGADGERGGAGERVSLRHDMALVMDHDDEGVVACKQEHRVRAERAPGRDARHP